jgi:hypothetical protein
MVPPLCRHDVSELRTPLPIFSALWRQLHPIACSISFWLSREVLRRIPCWPGRSYCLLARLVSMHSNGSRPEAFSLRPNDIIQWHAIHHAAKQGFRWSDMGEVPENRPQLAEYKSKWGTTPRRLYRYYYPQVAYHDGEGKPDQFLASVTDPIWRHMPARAAERIGEWMYSRL